MSELTPIKTGTILDTPLTPEMDQLFNDMAGPFNQAAAKWEADVTDTFITGSQQTDGYQFMDGGRIQAYNARVSVHLGFAAQGAPVDMLNTGGGNYSIYVDPHAYRYIWEERTAAESYTQRGRDIDPVHALAHAIGQGYIHLPKDHFTLTGTTAGEPTAAARALATEQGILADAMLTSMLANARCPAITNHPPTDRDKVMFSLLATTPDKTGRIPQPLTPEQYHQMATNRLRTTLYGDYMRFELPDGDSAAAVTTGLRRQLGAGPGA